MHHCLEACERTHATIAARLTPFLNFKRNNWDKILPSVTFALNTSVNSTGYSAFEILYGGRLAFYTFYSYTRVRYSGHSEDYAHLCKQFAYPSHVNVILQCVHTNTKHYKTQMLRSANESTRSLNLTVGDYVFLHKEPTGAVVTSKISVRIIKHVIILFY